MSELGHYSLIQYCPDLERLESVNVGVLLFSPKHDFLKAAVLRSNRRVQRFVGADGQDWSRFNSFKKAIVERIRTEKNAIRSVSDLEHWIAKRANHFPLTPPRWVRVMDPEQDLVSLFRKLVAPVPQRRSLAGPLREKLREAGVLEKLRTNLRLFVPQLGRAILAPFGYSYRESQRFHEFQPGFRVILPVRFESQDARQVVAKACRIAVEGAYLAERTLESSDVVRPLVVGSFSPHHPDHLTFVRDILKDQGVDLISFAEEVDDLIDDIRGNAISVSESALIPTS